MPRSARNKVVSLTQTEKKGRENKERIADELRTAMDTFAYLWVLDVENMRNVFLQEIRKDWEGSRIMFGKTKLFQKVLGRTPEEEYQDGLSQLTQYLSGEVGLLFTDEKPQVVKDYFDSFVKQDFARGGNVATTTFVIPEGVVYSTGGQQPEKDDVPLPHSREAGLRALGMPTRLQAGKVTLSAPHTVCKEGETLDSKQATLLKHFGLATASFKVNLVAYYSKSDAKVEKADD